MGASRSMMPAWRTPGWAFWCFLTIFRSATMARPESVRMLRTLPRLPRSRPVRTWTRSSRLILASVISEHLRGQRNDLHVILVAQLARHRAENARPARVVLVAQDDRGVVVEADVRAVRPAELLVRPDDHRPHDFALFDRRVRDRRLDRADDDI